MLTNKCPEKDVIPILEDPFEEVHPVREGGEVRMCEGGQAAAEDALLQYLVDITPLLLVLLLGQQPQPQLQLPPGSPSVLGQLPAHSPWKTPILDSLKEICANVRSGTNTSKRPITNN